MSRNITIKPGGSAREYWLDLWEHRQLLWILSKRDISVRYKQTLLGIAWSVIRPLATMVVMTIAFSVVAKLKPDTGVPYPLMVLGGITIWTFFANTFTQISNSITLNSNLVAKVYFPRLIMPLSAVSVGFVDFLIAFVLYLLISMVGYDYWPSSNIVFLPFFLLLTFITAFGFGLFFAAVNVRFRDIAQLIPFLVQVGIYACPIAYSSQMVAGTWWYKYHLLNPVVSLVDGFRWCLLGNNAYFDPQSLYSTVIVSTIALFISIAYFRKKESSFVDHL